jgi:hypothetical protein
MLNFTVASVAAFGKVSFVSKNHTLPALPDMNLLVLKNEDTFQAVCIDVEIDTIGSTVKNACDNLKQTLRMYVTQMVANYDGNVEAAVKDIINTSFGKGDVKSQLFNKYLETKQRYLLGRIAQRRTVKSRKEDFINAWNKVFQIEPIRLNLTSAEGIA